MKWHLKEPGFESIELPTPKLVLAALVDCPVCGKAIIAQPVHHLLIHCRECAEPIVIMLAPLVQEDAPSVWSFQARASNGKWNWLTHPGFVGIEEGEG